MPLKPGHVSDFTGSMAKAMEDALKSEWLAVKETPLPNVGGEDRQLLFVAIAQGILKYLDAHEADITTTTRHDTTSGHSHTVKLNVEVG